MPKIVWTGLPLAVLVVLFVVLPHMPKELSQTAATISNKALTAPSMTSASVSARLSRCLKLTPVSDPSINRSNILNCLQTAKVAVLAAGVFEVDHGITMPANTLLVSNSNAALKAVGTTDNFLLSTSDNNTVYGVTLDGNGNIFTLTSNGNVLRNSEVTGVCLGAIFGKSDSSHVNIIDATRFHDNACNNVTFVGYGVLRNSDLSRSGWNCNNGIPGGSIYSLNNIQGGLIENNKVHDDCGNLIDLDGVQRFTISNNQVLNPGVSFAEHDTFPVCAGSSMAIVDSSYNTIEDNEVQNNGAHNVIKNILYVGDDNVFFSMSGPFSDLPKGGDTMMAFWLGSSKSKPGSSVGNTVKNNGFRAACTGTCAGVGYYVGRGSGTTAGNYWSAQTTNYFTGNDSYVSNIGSKRCGANWYAANSTCTATPTDPACNNDDFQHTGDWARNDTCRYWDGD